MRQTDSIDGIRVRSIFHPSDFTEASEIAFVHALKIALATGADLSMLHIAENHYTAIRDFPGVRETLARWHLIPEGSPEAAVRELGIHVRKVVASGSQPVEACLAFLEKHAADLVVLAVHQQEGRIRWLEKSVGKPIAREVGEMTLFIPHGVEGFVSRKDGSVALRRILVPVTGTPLPQPAVDAAARLVRSLQLPAGEVTLLHVGAQDVYPGVKIPGSTGWTWNRVTKSGDPAETILKAASGCGADLIIMTTEGPDGFLDALRGSTTERVLNRTRCPVVSLPVGARGG